jgi:hypothetical protein
VTRIVRVETCDRCPYASGSRGCRHADALVDDRGVQTLRGFEDYFVIPSVSAGTGRARLATDRPLRQGMGAGSGPWPRPGQKPARRERG